MEKQTRFTIKIYRTIPHIIIFWIRLVAFAIILILVAASNIYPITVKYCDTASNFICIPLLTLFQFYFVILSINRADLFGMYISVALMINNAVFTLFVPALSPIGISTGYWVVLALLSVSFLLEALYMTLMIYPNLREYITGPSGRSFQLTEISNAFSTRQLIFALSQPNIFFACLLPGKLYLPPVVTERAVTGFVFGFTIMAFIEQLMIAINFNEEIIKQRIGITIISLLRILMGIATIVWYSLMDLSIAYEPRSKSVFFYLLSNALIISVVICFMILKDERLVGSGLRRWLARKDQGLYPLTL